ncbi:MAG: hypothetical protein ACFCA4_00715 [Cyanophyceae cyanobacterium]
MRIFSMPLLVEFTAEYWVYPSSLSRQHRGTLREVVGVLGN